MLRAWAEGGGYALVGMATTWSRVVWLAKLAGLATWSAVMACLGLAAWVTMAWFPFWTHQIYTDSAARVLWGCMALTCLEDKALCARLVTDAGTLYRSELVNATLACANQSAPFVVDYEWERHTLTESDTAGLVITSYIWLLATTFLIVTLCFFAALRLKDKYVDAWNAGPALPAAQGPVAAADGGDEGRPAAEGEGAELAPVA